MSKFKKSALSILFIVMLVSLLGCGNNSHPVLKGASKDLIFSKGYIINASHDVAYPYVDYDELFLGLGEFQPSTGKYSDTTADGKINWTIDGQEFAQTPIAKDMLKNITANGKEFSLPAKFSDIAEEYKVFDKVRFDKLEHDMCPCIITDNKTGNKITIDGISKENGAALFDIYNKDNVSMLSGVVTLDGRKIIMILTFDLNINGSIISNMDIRVNGIGAGNTLNEMYETFGMPYDITVDKVDDVNANAGYLYEDEEAKYRVIFSSKWALYDYRIQKKNTVRNNVITDVMLILK